MSRHGGRKRPIDCGGHAGDPRHRSSPEQRLLSAVLERALSDLDKGGLEGFQSRNWIDSNYAGPTYGFTFVYVCKHLGLDPEYVRERLPSIDLSKSRRLQTPDGEAEAVGE